ncbi:MAG: PAS domain S-box protein, partial [Anaerolineales bacterium]|nr:PAS domain S-box protein [Anaerolineales bacterium]
MYPALRILVIDTPQQELADLARAIKTEVTAQLDYHAVAEEADVPALIAETACDLVVYYGGEEQDTHRLTQHVRRASRSGHILVLLAEPTVDQAVTLMRAGSCGVVDKHDTRQALDLVCDVLTTEATGLATSIYQEIVENQTELICRYDGDFRLLFVNKAYCEWHETTAEALIGQTFLNTIPENERAQTIAKIRNLTAEKPVEVSSHAEIRPDGSLRVTEWTDRAIFNASGELIEYQGVGRDITERED